MSNGKRDKQQYTRRWMHNDCNLEQCFFGDHLIPDSDLPIAVCESAKTAVIMSIKNPAYIWLSSEGLTGLSIDKCKSIIDYDVTLYPDASFYENWNEKAVSYDFQISKDCERWAKAGLINDKDDIADYYLNKHPLSDYQIVKIDPDWNQEEYNNIFKNK